MHFEQTETRPATTQTYAERYAILRDTAERLRTGGPEDIDRLVEDFRRAMQAYEFCRTRIERVQAELNAEMARTGPLAAAPSGTDATV